LQLGAIISLVRTGKASLVNLGASGIGDISRAVSPYHDFSADDMNRDLDVRDLIQRGDMSMDSETRKNAYGTALALMEERAYVLPLFSIPTYYAAAKNLTFDAYADNIVRFWEMQYK